MYVADISTALRNSGPGRRDRLAFMNLKINGEDRVVSAETLSALVEQLGMKPDRVAVELNREIVPRNRWGETGLKDGDQLEIVHFVGGGSPHQGDSDISIEKEKLILI